MNVGFLYRSLNDYYLDEIEDRYRSAIASKEIVEVTRGGNIEWINNGYCKMNQYQ